MGYVESQVEAEACRTLNEEVCALLEDLKKEFGPRIAEITLNHKPGTLSCPGVNTWGDLENILSLYSYKDGKQNTPEEWKKIALSRRVTKLSEDLIKLVKERKQND